MLLKKGSKGGDTKRLQEKLGLTVDGSFGPGTEKAVKEWQSKNGLAVDGIITSANKSWSMMFEQHDLPGKLVEPGQPGLNFNHNLLKGHIPDSVLDQIPETAIKFNITTKLRLAHFLSQCAHESGNFKAVSENLNYSADGLKKIFGKYFPGNLNESYAKQPEKIASRVYGSRMGNGEESTKDGWKFRGRGYIQLTGKSNYESFDKIVEDKIIENPDLVATKYPLMSAAFFFDKNGLWSICDKGADDSTVTSVTKRVNGGTLGLVDRIKHFKEYYNLLK
jgi:putative chitinase